jgi:hypothetical protein
MKIDGVSIKGWRSFDGEGATLKHLRKVNIIIGPNNAGKSNLSRLLRKLKEIMASHIESARIRNSHSLMGGINPPAISPTVFQAVDVWKWSAGEIAIEIFPSKDGCEWPDNSYFLSQRETNQKLSIKSVIDKNKESIDFLIFGDGREIILDRSGNHMLNVVMQQKRIEDYPKALVFGFSFWVNLMDSLIFIDPIRHYSRPHKPNENVHIQDVPNFYFNGADLMAELINLQKQNTKSWGAYKKQMETWLKTIVDDAICNIALVEPDQYRLHFKLGEDEIIQDLDALGTGVAQVVMLLSFLHLNKGKKLNVFMDEPESNLHFTAVGKLVQIFTNELPNHNFFLTTHSPALLDQVADNWSIYRATNKPHGATKFLSCNSVVQHYKLLDDLGVSASQILQTNMVIWVEGPSDAIYLKKWIGDSSNDKLIAGTHYSFLFYGGANLASHTLLDDENEKLVDMLATSRYAAIICDSDCKSKVEFDGRKFKDRVKGLIERLEKIANNEDTDAGRDEGKSGIKDFVEVWVTAGREIENYVPEKLFRDILLEPPFRKEFIKSDDGAKCLLEVNSENIVFGEFDSFDSAFAAAYKEDGKPVNDKAKQKISEKYSQNKVEIAKAVVGKWDSQRHNQFDLGERIKSLVDLIKKANAMQF